MARRKSNFDKQANTEALFENLLEDAAIYLDDEEGEQAERILRKLLAKGHDTAEVRIGLAEALFQQGMLLEGDDEANRAIELAESDEEKVQLLAIKAHLMLAEGYPPAAMKAFARIDEEHPEYAAKYSSIFVTIMSELEKYKEAWKWFEDRLAKPEELTPVDVAYYAKAWLELMVESERTEFKDKLTRMFKRAVEKITDPDERELLFSELSVTAMSLTDDVRYREAELFVDLALFINPSSPPMVEAKREMKRFAAVQNEVERMMADDSLFPLVTLRACEWFYDNDDGELADEMLESLPEELVEALSQDRRAFADGIKRLRKKYQATYEMFKEDWEALYDELVGKSGGVIQLPRR